MEAFLLTLLLIGLMVVALIVLGRTWPRSSKLGGYRARSRGEDRATPMDEERGEVPREDDDTRWRWE